MPLIHAPKRYPYLIVFGILLAPLGVINGLGWGAIFWSFVVVIVGIAGDADYVNENLNVNVRRWKWLIAAIVTSVFTGLFYLYRRRVWFKRNADLGA